MNLKPLESKNIRKSGYKTLDIVPLHINHPGISLPVENLDISQQFSPSYNKEEVYGRMDPIVTYKNTGRSMRFSFSCQAHHYFDGNLGVSDNVYQINLLTQFLYPAYQSTDSTKSLLRSPPFFRIRYGSYVGSYSGTGVSTGLTGYITGFSHQLGKIARNMAYASTAEGNHLAVPREIKVSFSFEVIHDKDVGWRRAGEKDKFSINGYDGEFPYRSGFNNTSAPSETPSEDDPSTQKDKVDEAKGDGKSAIEASVENSPEKENSTAKKGAKSVGKQVNDANIENAFDPKNFGVLDYRGSTGMDTTYKLG